MAKQLSKQDIVTRKVVKPWHVSQSVDALTGIEAYDITISGSLTVTGSVAINGLIDTAQSDVLTIDTTTGQIYYTASSAVGGGGGGGTPAGNNYEIQYNDNGNFGATNSFKFNYLSESLEQGPEVIASGLWSHAQGSGSQALKTGSHAEGLACIADGTDLGFLPGYIGYSHAEGFATVASGSFSHAEGIYTLAIGLGDHAEGYYTTASGISTGGGNPIYGSAHAEGGFTRAFGAISHAEGYFTETNGIGSHTEGSGTNTPISGGNFSHAEGFSTTASGDLFIGGIIIGASHAEGYRTFSSGSFSHAEGLQTISKGLFSHAEGSGSISEGLFSHAEGKQTLALGSGSHAEGIGTIASGSFQHVQGTYNTQGDSTSLMIVGNGTSDVARKDAFKVTSLGSVILPTTQSTSPGWTGTDGEMVFATVSGNHLFYVWMAGNWRSGSLS